MLPWPDSLLLMGDFLHHPNEFDCACVYARRVSGVEVVLPVHGHDRRIVPVVPDQHVRLRPVGVSDILGAAESDAIALGSCSPMVNPQKEREPKWEANHACADLQ